MLIYVWCLDLVTAVDFYLGSHISFLRFCVVNPRFRFFVNLSFNYRERI